MPTKINKNVYGLENEWLVISPDTYNIKLATFANEGFSRPAYRHTIGGGKFLNKLTNDFDISIAPIAVDNKSSLVNTSLCGYVDDFNNVTEIKSNPVQSALMYCCNPSNSSNNFTNAKDYVSAKEEFNTSWLISQTGTVDNNADYPTNAGSLIQPIVDFSYKSIILTIWLVVSDKIDTLTTADIQFCDYESYYNTESNLQGDYPFVLSVLAVPKYLGNDKYFNLFTNQYIYNLPSTINQTWANFGVVPLESANYNIANDFVKYIYNVSLLGEYDGIYFDTTRNIARNAINGCAIVIGGYKNSYSTGLYNNKGRFIQIVGNDIFKLKVDSTRYDRLYAYCDNIIKLKDWILTNVAYLGMFYSTSYKNSLNNADDNFYNRDTTYLGIIDNNGITHGQYLKGQDIKKSAQAKWDSIKDNSNYDYTKKPDYTKYDNILKPRIDRLKLDFFTRKYLMNRQNILDLSTWLYDEYAPTATIDSNNQSFLTQNPIDNIVSIIYYPMIISDIKGDTTNFKIGNLTPQKLIDIKSINNSSVLVDLGAVEYFKYFNNFLDYEPYSNALLYLPFCGYIDLSPSDFIGHYVGVQYILDYATCSCDALVYRDNYLVKTITGQFGVQLPFGGIAQADYLNSIQRATINYKQALIGSATAVGFGALATAINPVAVGGAISNVVSSGLTIEKTAYELEHLKKPMVQSTSCTPSSCAFYELSPKIILKRPIFLDTYNPQIYGKTVGFACCINDYLYNYTGLTICSDLYLECAATVDEINMIKTYFQKGVIL